MEDLMSFDASPDRKAVAALQQPVPEDMLQRPRRQVYLAPVSLLEQWTKDKRRRTQPNASSPRGQAYLILSHDKRLEDGVIEAVHFEMVEFARGREDIRFTLQGSRERPFLYIEAPSQDLAIACLDEARTCADNIIHDRTVKFDFVLVEPPASTLDVIQVKLADNRPQLLPSTGGPATGGPATGPSEHDDAALQNSEIDKAMLQQLTMALKKAGRIKVRVNLRVHLGHYLLTSVPQNIPQAHFTLEQLTRIVRHARTKDEFATQMGNLREALRVLNTIKTSQLFLSEDMAVATMDVRPEFYFDAHSSKWRMEAHLRPLGEIMPSMPHEKGAFKIAGIHAIEIVEKRQGTQLNFKTLSLGQTFDWKIETVPDAAIKHAGYRPFEAEVRAATVQFPSKQARDEDFPRLHFQSPAIKAQELREVAIRSVFRFRYSPAPYQVEFTIRRTWPNVKAMANNRYEPVTTFGITVYGEDWGETRATEIVQTGQGWGQELEHLFRDSPGSTHGNESDVRASGEERVQAFVNIIRDIRRALST
ncbi:hypothetical protein SCUP234_12217 [Seiridium cupressi]